MIGGEEGLTIVRNGWARFWKVSILWFGSIALFEQRLSTIRDCRERVRKPLSARVSQAFCAAGSSQFSVTCPSKAGS